jgi:hypothetical protein
MVFVFDAVLLAAVIAQAPPPPEQVGAHGHSELMSPHSEDSAPQHTGEHDLNARALWQKEGARDSIVPWIMILDPIDLFRLTLFSSSWGGSDHTRAVLPLDDQATHWLPLLAGWLAWMALPPFVGFRRFRRISLF